MGWDPTVAIVGSGFGGITIAYELRKQLGLTNFTIYEREEEVGGTWWVNSYPGCACDVPSHFYSFSFNLNPEWNRKFSPREEILQHIKDTVTKFDLRKYIQFQMEVQGAEWDDKTSEWKLTILNRATKEVRNVRANILVLATGILRDPNIPENLISKFEGEWVHSARWRKDFKTEGKTVAVIGTGTSASQIISAIAPGVKDLYVYQRTASWVLPRDDYEYGDFIKFIFRWFAFTMILYRLYLYCYHELLYNVFATNKPLSKPVTAFGNYMGRTQLKKQVPSETLRKALTPNFSLGCKRIIFSDDFLPALSRPNVHIISDPISVVEKNMICTRDGTKTTVDALILATGFKADHFATPMKIVARGVDLEKHWNGVPRGYYGLCCNKFPNAFFLLGPNSALGHSSVQFIIECQVSCIIDLIRSMRAQNMHRAEVTKDAEDEFNVMIQKELKETVWQSGGCKSWYQTSNGDNFTLYTRSTTAFWWETRKANLSHFTLLP